MRFDTTVLPPDSVQRARAQLAALDPRKALTTCRKGKIPIDSLGTEFKECFERLCKQNAFGVVLSAYYEAGQFAEPTVDYLLQKMFEVRDYAGFLKQAYRFNAYPRMKAEVDTVVQWHLDKKRNDAQAWQRKFRKLEEQELLRLPDIVIDQPTVELQEEMADSATDEPKTFILRPMSLPQKKRRIIEPENPSDPYIVSHVARVKIEQANAVHAKTLAVLRSFLESLKFTVSDSKLIDAFTELSTGPAIFEVKSITENNEREQIRHALSQLYEYRFLHALPTASLWGVFSQPLSSGWYIDYLLRDRGVSVVWARDGMLEGPSLNVLHY
jgi:hypothetical protein